MGNEVTFIVQHINNAIVINVLPAPDITLPHDGLVVISSATG
jgi:hypothetical protein